MKFKKAEVEVALFLVGEVIGAINRAREAAKAKGVDLDNLLSRMRGENARDIFDVIGEQPPDQPKPEDEPEPKPEDTPDPPIPGSEVFEYDKWLDSEPPDSDLENTDHVYFRPSTGKTYVSPKGTVRYSYEGAPKASELIRIVTK